MYEKQTEVEKGSGQVPKFRDQLRGYHNTKKWYKLNFWFEYLNTFYVQIV